MSFDSIVYRKLVRDKIPEIIQMSGKDPVFRGLAGSELCEALGRKLLEEAFEFFASWQNGNAKEILCESADILEVILEALKEHGYNLDDLIRARDQRKQERGGFSGHIFLENVGGPPGAETEFDDPRVFLSPEQNRQLIELINQEFSRSEA
ncbi:MAG: restriction endonuclease subunit R, partial [Deltaproteobacteria bacterium CG17_big_fil_post_rev_8_21_14_2_50_51_6]